MKDIKKEKNQNLEAGKKSQEQAKIEELEKQLKETQEKATYLAADFENFKKRSLQDCQNQIESSKHKIFLNFLSIVDDFERAISEIEKKPEIKPHLAGVEIIYKNILNFLEQNNIKEIDLNILEFNPDTHEAIVMVDDENKKSGQIVEIFKKGYLFNDKLLRAAKVSVKK